MKRFSFFIYFLTFLSIQTVFAQSQQLWKGYFSYNDIKDVSQSDNKLYVASENAIFVKDLSTNQIKTISTIEGLSSQVITAIYHSPIFKKTLVGYENGLMIVINEKDGMILNVVDIINKQIPSNIKKINHFNENQGKVYISCDFGIVVYDLNTLEFGDTYFIGTSKSEIPVTQTTISDGYIYASTATEGIKKGLLSNPNLVDATQWQVLISGNFSGITAFNDSLFSTSTNGNVYRSSDGNVFLPFGLNLSPAAIDIRQEGNYLLLTTPNVVQVYDAQLNLTAQIQSSQVSDESAVFSCATTIGQSLFIGTNEKGIVVTQLNNPATFEQMNPNGPFKNNIFSITVAKDVLWATYGGYNQYYEPFGKRYGFSKYHPEQGWLNVPFTNVDGANDLVRITVNPKDENQIFVSSYDDGLLKYQNQDLVIRYDQYNSGLESLFYPNYPGYQSVRIEQTAFDKDGNLWVTNESVKSALKVLKKNGEWKSYSTLGIIPDYLNGQMGRMVIDKNGTKWFCTIADGLVGFNEAKGDLFRKITEGTSTGNLPDPSVQVAAIDNNNQIWIGTRKGLRVLPSLDRFVSGGNLTTSPVIILEDGVAQELMFEQFITDIVVDGANNKWVSTVDSGVFQFSPDGQKTLQHFTSSNSPLPSNNVNDVDINGTTGEVFFATNKGMVSFKGSAVKASENFDNVVIYPNPVRPNYDGTVKINGLMDKSNVKITDMEGNLVHEATSEGGSIEWDTTAFGKYKVHSGVYMVFLASKDGGETQIKKVMIVR